MEWFIYHCEFLLKKLTFVSVDALIYVVEISLVVDILIILNITLIRLNFQVSSVCRSVRLYTKKKEPYYTHIAITLTKYFPEYIFNIDMLIAHVSWSFRLLAKKVLIVSINFVNLRITIWYKVADVFEQNFQKSTRSVLSKKGKSWVKIINKHTHF